MTTFADLNLSQIVLKNVTEAGYKTPTPIQEQIIPHILRGADVLGCAQTGTGKTASFTLPLIQKLMERPAKARMPRCIVLIPTRELAIQVQSSFDKYSRGTGLTHTLLIGGTGVAKQEQALSKGVDVIIATPGRLLDLHERGRMLLMGIQFLILDEADRMLDMGFMPDIERLTALLPKSRQSLLFSATMPSDVRKLALKILKTPIEVTVSSPKKTAETISQFALNVANDRHKSDMIQELLNKTDTNQVIVFCNTKKVTNELTAMLKAKGVSVGALHGDLNQEQRTMTLASFTKSEIKILIASDIAARGIDIDTISHVINYDVPHSRDDYIHRIGRTGRAGQTGISLTFISGSDIKLWSRVFNEKTDVMQDWVTKNPFKTTTERVSYKPESITHKDSKARAPRVKSNTSNTSNTPNATNTPNVELSTDFQGFGDMVPSFFNTSIELDIKKSDIFSAIPALRPKEPKPKAEKIVKNQDIKTDEKTEKVEKKPAVRTRKPRVPKAAKIQDVKINDSQGQKVNQDQNVKKQDVSNQSEEKPVKASVIDQPAATPARRPRPRKSVKPAAAKEKDVKVNKVQDNGPKSQGE